MTVTKNNHSFTVADYILAQLKSQGVDHIFGIPGDFILPFFEKMVESDVMHVACCNELNAGYAADGYARLKGLGVAVVTNGPGSFSIVNAVAGAYAENVPLVVISGGPVAGAYTSQPVLHHVLPDKYEASINIFEQITTYAKLLDQPDKATVEIDKALSICLAEKKPVYLEIPTDVQLAAAGPPKPLDLSGYIKTDKAAAKRSAKEIARRITQSRRTIILPGHEIHRWRLQDKVIELLDKTGIPAASMFIGKADYLEQLPACIGAYQGAGSLAEVRDYIEDADTVIFLGLVPSDFNLGGFTAQLSDQQTITIWNNKIKTAQKTVDNIAIVDVLNALLEYLPAEIYAENSAPSQIFSHKPDADYEANAGEPLSNKRFYDRLANFLEAGDIVLADAGCAINITHLQLPADTTYIASCYWASIGMGFGATLGACFAASDGQRVIALIGDGSFQMTAQELSSMNRYGKSPIVFVVNNRGYTAERLIHDGPFNDIAAWNYHKLPDAFGGGTGVEVHTEGDLEVALEQAALFKGPGPMLIEVHIDPWDTSEAFRLMSEVLRSH